MKRITQRRLLIVLIIMMVLSVSSCKKVSDSGITSYPSSQKEEVVDSREEISVSVLSAERISSSELKISWSFSEDSVVDSYNIMRRCEKEESPEWIVAGTVKSNGSGSYSFMDTVDSSVLSQYKYRIEIVPKDNSIYRSGEGRTCLISNILICLDPGHFLGSSHLEGEKVYNYEEGVATLKLGLMLSKILKEEYGITSYLTREKDSIKINGYINGALDHYHINLRGEYAAGSDLFISLHTNANNPNVNGYPTISQPISINKPIVIVNTCALKNKDVISMSNAIGNQLVKVYSEKGLATVTHFDDASIGSIKEWTQSYNDGVDVAGTVCKRTDSDGDYYGVLRGASKVGVPGVIIEHGYHTVPEVRYAAMNEDLLELLARADASGIASYVK